MKKTTLFLMLLFCAVVTQAQRITSLTVEGKSFCVPFTAFNPTNNSETVLGDGQMVFPAGTDLSNVNVTIGAGTDASIVEPNPIPTNWTSVINGVKVLNSATAATKPNEWAKYSVTLKVIKPANLPLEIKTGTDNFNSDSWTSETLGWAGACIDKNNTVIRFGGSKRSFVVAFNDAPDSLFYTIKFLATPWNTSNVFDVDGSVDGVNWSSIVQYNATNAMPLSSPAVESKLKISGTYRYIRWIYTTRAASNILLENIKVTKDLTSGTFNQLANSVKLYSTGFGSLRLESPEEVAFLKLYNIDGSIAFEIKNPQTEIRANELLPGIYISEIRMRNGQVVSKKFVR